jgi:hypothetical protein
MTLGTVLLVVAVVVVLAVVFFAIALARKGKRQYEAQGTAPGLSPGAPREWAGQHSPEAKLHRRLATAARSLSAHPLGDAAAIEQRVTIEQQILQLDQHLVAVAAVRGPDTAATITALEPEVASVERAVANLATASIDPLHRDELDPGDSQ